MISTQTSLYVLCTPLLSISVILGTTIFGTINSAFAQGLVLQVSNNTNSVLTELYISPTSVDIWEDNHLSRDMGPNTQLNIPIGGANRGCIYDVLGIFGDGDKVEEYQLDFCAMGAYAFQTFLFQNSTGLGLVELHVSPSSSDNWQQNRLGDGMVVRSGTAPIEIKLGANGDEQTCFYDVLGTFTDDSTIEDYEINFCTIGVYEFPGPDSAPQIEAGIESGSSSPIAVESASSITDSQIKWEEIEWREVPGTRTTDSRSGDEFNDAIGINTIVRTGDAINFDWFGGFESNYARIAGNCRTGWMSMIVAGVYVGNGELFIYQDQLPSNLDPSENLKLALELACSQSF
jgi:hypothetical protein